MTNIPLQTYFWTCILEDNSQISEINSDGSLNSYVDIAPEARERTIYFGLSSFKDSHFFDLNTGEYHHRDMSKDEKHKLQLPSFMNSAKPITITGPLPEGTRCEFFQWKKGHTDFDISFKSSGNIIDEHIIGYTINRLVNGQRRFVKVTLTLNPNEATVKPNLKIEVKDADSENCPVLGEYSYTI